MQRIFSDQEKQKFIEAYPTTPIAELAKSFGVSEQDIIQRAYRYGIKRAKGLKKGMNKRITLSDDEIKRLYHEENKSTAQIGKIAGCTAANISIILRKLGATKSASMTHKRYALDQTFFENIDTAEKAWVFGWICTDGSIWGGRATSLALRWDDEWIISRIRQALKTDTPIQVIPAREKPQVQDPTKIMHMQPQRRLVVYSKKMFNDLYDLGLTENKSLTLAYPDVIPDHLFGHFLRGCIEGDGSVYVREEKPYFSRIQLTGTHEFLTGIAKKIQQITGCGKYYLEQKSDKNTYTITYTARSGYATELFNLIYTDSEDMRLDRKYQKALTWLEHSKLVFNANEQAILDAYDDLMLGHSILEDKRKLRSHGANNSQYIDNITQDSVKNSQQEVTTNPLPTQ